MRFKFLSGWNQLTKGLHRFNGPVRIEVGPRNDCEIFTTDAETLTFRSSFFKTALSGGFKEAKDRVVKLPEDDAEAFEVYLHYLQTNELSVLPDPMPKDYIGIEERTLPAHLYVMAEKFQDVKLKNAIIKALIVSSYTTRTWNGRCWLPSSQAVSIIYKGTASGSMARKLVVHLIAWEFGMPVSMILDHWPYEFLSEFAYELLAHRDYKLDKKKRYWRKHHPEEYMEEEIQTQHRSVKDRCWNILALYPTVADCTDGWNFPPKRIVSNARWSEGILYSNHPSFYNDIVDCPSTYKHSLWWSMIGRRRFLLQEARVRSENDSCVALYVCVLPHTPNTVLHQHRSNNQLAPMLNGTTTPVYAAYSTGNGITS